MNYVLNLVPQNLFFSSKIEENFELLFAIYADRIAELKEVEISKVNINNDNSWYFEAVNPEGVMCSTHGDTLYNTFCYGVLMTMIVDWGQVVLTLNGVDYTLSKRNIDALQGLYIHNTLFPAQDRMLLKSTSNEYEDFNQLVDYGFASVKVLSKSELEAYIQKDGNSLALLNLLKVTENENEYFKSYHLTELGFEIVANNAGRL